MVICLSVFCQWLKTLGHEWKKKLGGAKDLNPTIKNFCFCVSNYGSKFVPPLSVINYQLPVKSTDTKKKYQ